MEIKLRDMLRKPASFRRHLEKRGRIVITGRDGPFALVIPLTSKALSARRLLMAAGKILKEAGITEQEALKLLKIEKA